MVPSKHKISHAEFMTYLKGKHTPFSLGEVVFKDGLQNGLVKCAVIVPKKSVAKAHDRNTIKRFYYGILERQIPFLAQYGRNCVILIKKKINSVDETFSKDRKKALEQEINAYFS